MKSLFIYILIILFTFSNGQYIEGTVTDSYNNPIENVTVIKNETPIDYTNEKGQFQFELNAKGDSIRFSKEGFTIETVSTDELLNVSNPIIQLNPLITLEPIIFDSKKYRKKEITLGLKKKANVRTTVIPKYEIASKIFNPSHKKGKISSVILYLHKTTKEVELTDLAINFYTINPITGYPDKPILLDPILFKPKKKNRGKRKIDVEKYQIPFPKEGIFVSVKWLETKHKKKKGVGPSLRMTYYSSKKLTYTRYNNRNWSVLPKLTHNNSRSNAMIGLEVWVRKD